MVLLVVQCSVSDVCIAIQIDQREHQLKFVTVRTAPAVAGYGTALAILLGAWEFAGAKITGYNIDPTVDEVARKEYLRKNRRRPIEETLEQVGEGRGKPSIRLVAVLHANPDQAFSLKGTRKEEQRD